MAASGRLVGGRYRLVDRLGAGGFGRVWRALDTSLEVEVAIKEVVLPPELTDAERTDRLTRARREARSAARLRGNPHVVSVHDVVIDDETPWIVMELVPGRSLAERLRADGALSVEQTTRVARALLIALGASHAAGIVHRDVKPANVMLTDDGQVQLTDFGIAVLTTDTRLTTAGHFIGSVEYLAPERAKGEESRPAADMFSLGATLYHAVEGTSAFARDTAAATLGAVLFDGAPAPSRAGALTPLLAALLSKDPNARPDSARALRMLDEIGSGSGVAAPSGSGVGVGVGGAGAGAGTGASGGVAASSGSGSSAAAAAAAAWSAATTAAGAGAAVTMNADAGWSTPATSTPMVKTRKPAAIWKAARAVPFLLLAAVPLVPVLHVGNDEIGITTYSAGLHVGFVGAWDGDNGVSVWAGVAFYISLLLALVFWAVPGMRRGWKVVGYVLGLAALAETVVYTLNIGLDLDDHRYELADALGPTGGEQDISPFIFYAPALALLTLVLYIWRDSSRWRQMFRRAFISAPR
ncbi:hypothetical protein GCM10009839_37860 [Catenulispora yoronensis]|uniref:non-specific serine/threonine protein kinase n=1 Tax=Catenulispora yoronensis TaxID=450799 RepID=A0ABN2UBC1_9ACTN